MNKYMVCSDVKDFKKYIMEATKNNTEIVVNGEKLLTSTNRVYRSDYL